MKDREKRLDTLVIRRILSVEDLKISLDIRFKVFVEGQGVSIDDELDDKDEESMHYLALFNDYHVATARVRKVEHIFKIERVAVLDGYQGRGIGREIMTFILTDLRVITKIKEIKLGSQTHAIPFYEKLGFVVTSEEYMDAGIPHKDMQLFL